MKERSMHFPFSLLRSFGGLIVFLTIFTQTVAFRSQINAQDVSFAPATGLAYFVITWGSAPDFSLDRYGLPTDSFQIWINPPSAGAGLYPPENPYTNILIHGDEIHVNDQIVLRNIGPPQDSDPHSGGWGPIIGSVPFSLSGGSISCSIPMALLGVTGAFNYLLIIGGDGRFDFPDALATATPVAPPTIQKPPQTQTAEAGSAVGLRVDASGSLPLFCLWYLNATNLISWSTNREFNLTNAQFAQSGAYTVVISNAFGAVTSSPAMLNVIAAVEHRAVPGVKVTGNSGSLLNVDGANFLSRSPNWTPLGSVSLTNTSQYYFDLTIPLPPQRFYRAWQTGMPSAPPSLDLHLVPAITLTGSIGHSVRLDYINQFGPTDAWITLDTVTLSNTSQLYFDVSATGQAPRLYRLVQVP